MNTDGKYNLEKRKGSLWYFLYCKRTRLWMEGYYASQIDQKKGLSDIPLTSLDKRYLFELGKRADKETKEVDNLRDRREKVV